MQLNQAPLDSQSQPLPLTFSLPLAALPSLKNINTLRVPTLRHVPKGARDAWARVIKEALQGILSDSTDIDVWKKWFMLPQCVLYSGTSGRKRSWRDTLKSARMRIRRWREGNCTELWSEVTEVKEGLTHRRKKRKESTEALRANNARRARNAIEEGQYKKATQALTSSGLAQASEEVYKEMLAKHPQDDPPQLYPLPPPPL